jgi:hypothetical protein
MLLLSASLSTISRVTEPAGPKYFRMCDPPVVADGGNAPA